MSNTVDLQTLSKRAEEAESLISALQTQLDYLKARSHLSLTGKFSTSHGHGHSELDNVQQRSVTKSEERERVDIEQIILNEIEEKKSVDSREISSNFNIHPNDVYGAINSLEGDGYVEQSQQIHSVVSLTEEGQAVVKQGSPEVKVYEQVPENDLIAVELLQSKLDPKIYKIGLGKAFTKKWLSRDNDGNIRRTVNKVRDETQEELMTIEAQGASGVNGKTLTELKKRKLVQNKEVKYYIIKAGKNYSIKRVKALSELTIEDINTNMDLKSGEWRGPPLKPYNFDAKGVNMVNGGLHPLMKMRGEMRRILLDMGFEEMPTNNYVESSFWNFDSLFQPQQHPARDAHDTFFLKKPCSAQIEAPEYMKIVKQTHCSGGFGSIGWRYDWKQSEAQKTLLRTHTTAISSRMLYALAQQKNFQSKKYFSIDRVFRNEAIDATHLAEFHQVEGLIADYGLTLGHLIGVITQFFQKIGIPKVSFKPAYNPYTEPSMEIFGWSEERQKWIEVGNSGVFRPEMLQPMGFPPQVQVIAWGLGLERPCMIATKCKDIRELFGPKVDVNMVQDFRFVRYDKIQS